MTSGIVSNIQEFAVHDGPGIRTTVLLKGCPLACQWCSNPDGQTHPRQLMPVSTGERWAGKEYSAWALAARLNEQAAVLKRNAGGVTFSGGEPLLQARFVAEVIDRLDGLHVLLDTSGYGRADHLRLLLERVDLVYFDLKLVNPQAHRRYIRRNNTSILRNLDILTDSSVPFVVRVPLVPGITDTDDNLAGIARVISGRPGLERVDLLPYHRATGARCEAGGRADLPKYNENQLQTYNLQVFEQNGIKVRLV